MSLKYNSRAELENKLKILKCCIGTKGIELSNSIALALGDVDCLTKELEVLNKYYEILSCYYPYDCWSLTGCTEAEVLEQYIFLMDIADAETISDWITDVNTVNAEIHSIVNGNTYTIPITDPTFLITIRNYINTNSTTLGYTATFTSDDTGITWTITKLDCDTPIYPGSFWAFDLVNETLAQEFNYIAEPEGTSTCACDEECCNIKVIPEVIEYTLVTPQSLEEKDFFIDHAGDGGTINTWIVTNGDTINVRIYNILTGVNIVIPFVYTIGANRNTLYTYITNYINANRFVLGYTISRFLDSGFDLFTMIMLDCTDTGIGDWGFDVINVTLSTTISEHFTPDHTSTCAVYSTEIIHPETTECQENCLTDEQAEKIIRHAMSLCECCSDIYINNNLE